MTAPMITKNYPGPEYPVGKAWAAMWAELAKASRRKDPYLEGRDLAGQVAPDFGLEPVTMTAVLSRAAKRGLLVTETRPVPGERGVRNRAHYRINPDA